MYGNNVRIETKLVEDAAPVACAASVSTAMRSIQLPTSEIMRAPTRHTVFCLVRLFMKNRFLSIVRRLHVFTSFIKVNFYSTTFFDKSQHAVFYI